MCSQHWEMCSQHWEKGFLLLKAEQTMTWAGQVWCMGGRVGEMSSSSANMNHPGPWIRRLLGRNLISCGQILELTKLEATTMESLVPQAQVHAAKCHLCGLSQHGYRAWHLPSSSLLRIYKAKRSWLTNAKLTSRTYWNIADILWLQNGPRSKSQPANKGLFLDFQHGH